MPVRSLRKYQLKKEKGSMPEEIGGNSSLRGVPFSEKKKLGIVKS